MIKQPLSPDPGCLKRHFLKVSILVFSSCIFSKGSPYPAQKFNGRRTGRNIVQIRQNSAFYNCQFCNQAKLQLMLCSGSNFAHFSPVSVVLNAGNYFSPFNPKNAGTRWVESDCFSSECVCGKQLLHWLCVHCNQTKDSDSGQDLIICQPQTSECPTVTIKFTEMYFLKEKWEGVNC